MEFFNNIWLWFVNNSNEIVLTITSANFISFITSIILLFKTLKSTKDNTKSSNELNNGLNNVNSLISYVKDINDKLTTSSEKINTVDSKINKFVNEEIELLNLLLSKYNLMIEAQLQVWSTIKDDNIRNNVNTILTSAKYKETSTIIDLKNQIDELKNKMIEKTEEFSMYVKNNVTENIEIKEDVEEIVSKIENKITRI